MNLFLRIIRNVGTVYTQERLAHCLGQRKSTDSKTELHVGDMLILQYRAYLEVDQIIFLQRANTVEQRALLLFLFGFESLL